MPSREALLLPDRITPYDNLDLLPPPDVGLLLSQMEDVTATPSNRKGRVSHRDINLQEDFNNSQFLQDGLDKDDELALAHNGDLELDLDFGMDIDDGTMEMGRDAPAARPIEDDMFSDLGIQAPHKDNHRDLSLELDFGDGVQIADNDGDIMMGDDLQFNLDDPSALPLATHGPDMSRARGRDTESLLSDVDEDVIQRGDEEFTRNDAYTPGDDTANTIVQRKAPQRSKKRKILLPDEETMLSSAHIREQQAHHENILKPQSFLPRDPYVLALMEMQKGDGFVANIMENKRSLNLAPELQGLFNLQTIFRPNDLKRKRDSGIADMDSDQGASKSPRLDIGDDDPFAIDGGDLGNQTVAADGTILEIPGDEGIFNHDDDDTQVRDRDAGTPMPAFDDTVAPLVHPADSGPVSLGTKHAVHILRDLFGGSEMAANSDKRKKATVVFQELLPERATTKADATKMFFECLVLATKDAIKVEQPEGSLGGPIRVRGKRGLWGAWAEREAGGEIASQMEPVPAIASGSAAVAVEA